MRLFAVIFHLWMRADRALDDRQYNNNHRQGDDGTSSGRLLRVMTPCQEVSEWDGKGHTHSTNERCRTTYLFIYLCLFVCCVMMVPGFGWEGRFIDGGLQPWQSRVWMSRTMHISYLDTHTHICTDVARNLILFPSEGQSMSGKISRPRGRQYHHQHFDQQIIDIKVTKL